MEFTHGLGLEAVLELALEGLHFVVETVVAVASLELTGRLHVLLWLHLHVGWGCHLLLHGTHLLLEALNESRFVHWDSVLALQFI